MGPSGVTTKGPEAAVLNWYVICRPNNMHKQRTLKKIVSATGVGLHSGDKVHLSLRPAPVNTGIVFTRTDLSPPVELKATPEMVGDTTLSTCLTARTPAGEVRLQTVEHLMCALMGLGVDNAYVDVSAAEIPAMDGSAGTFVYLIQSAGLLEQEASKRFVRIKKPMRIDAGDKFAEIRPHNGYRLSFSIHFNHPAVDRTETNSTFDFAEHSFIRDVARARTFGFTKDIEGMRERGLALGGGMVNAIVMDDFRVLNAEGLRQADEFVKHKILDAIGDLYVFGHPFIGAYSAHKSGHALNNQLLRALLADQSAWEFVSFAKAEDVPKAFWQEDWRPGQDARPVAAF